MAENMMLPIELTKILYSSWEGELRTSGDDQIYGKSLNGPCKVTFKNGNTYSGEFKNGMLHGRGVFTWASGIQYEGDFANNKLEGKGTYKWPDGSHYEGEVSNGLRHGHGKLTLEDCVYQGQWKQGSRHGQGKITFTNGGVYEGYFENGAKCGKGKMYYPSGNFYEGQWKDDKKNGHGIMHWIDTREKYTGQWVNNLQQGWGVHIWLDSKGEGKYMRNRYQGEWKSGLREGFGTFYYANGSKYEGYWLKNMKEGYAFFTNQLGIVTQTFFKNDRMSKEEEGKASTRTEDMQTGKSKTASNPSTYRPNKEVEINPYSHLAAVANLFVPFNPDLEQLCNYLLRNNSQIKTWYKTLCNFYDNHSENTFCINLENVWKVIRTLKVLGNVSLATVNRSIPTFKPLVKKLLEQSQKYEKKVPLDEFYYFEQSHNYEDIELWQKPKPVENQTELDEEAVELANIHNSSRNILLREFVEILICLSNALDPNPFQPHKSLEKLINKMAPILEGVSKADRRISEASDNQSSLSKSEKSIPQFAKAFNSRLFQNLTEESCRRGKRNSIDRTIPLKRLYKLLKMSNIFNEADVPLLEKLVERHLDPQYWNSKSPLVDGSPAGKLSYKLIVTSEYELIEFQFVEFMFYYLVKKLPSSKDTEDNRNRYEQLTKKIQEAHRQLHYQQLNFLHCHTNIRVQQSAKKHLKKQLIEKRRLIQIQRAKQEAKKRELQREEAERKLMELNDLNIVEETFEEEEELDSQY